MHITVEALKQAGVTIERKEWGLAPFHISNYIPLYIWLRVGEHSCTVTTHVSPDKCRNIHWDDDHYLAVITEEYELSAEEKHKRRESIMSFSSSPIVPWHRLRKEVQAEKVKENFESHIKLECFLRGGEEA